MTHRTQGAIEIFAAIVVLFSAMWNPKISLVVAVAVLLLLGLYQIFKDKGSLHSGRDDMSGDPLNPEQIAKRRENLDKIMKLAGERPKIYNNDVEKSLGVSDATATRYLSYLVDLGKLVRVGERGQQVYYQLPPR